jgi:hypothetical protein
VDTTQTTPDATVRLCSNCRAGMERHQDWCLECGTAAAGRLGGLRPGWRAVTTTLALTLVLVGGAGAASYAALSSDANREAIAAAPMDGTPVAQAPPAVPAPAAPVVPAPVVPVVPVPPAPATPAPALPAAPKVSPVAPASPKITAQVTPPKVTPKTSPRSAPGSDDTAAGSRGKGTNADGEDTAADKKLEPIALGADALSIYDPYKRAVSPGDPAEAYDGNAKTTFEIGAPDDGRELQVGVVVDLEAAKQVRGIDLKTTTRGGRIEVYATDGSALPPDILDTRWDHPGSRSSVDRAERIVFPKGGANYRYVTLWFTTPPKGAHRVGLSELKLLG